MSNILDPATMQVVKTRIRAVSSEDVGRWGRMNTGQMICHLADQIRVALGETRIPVQGSFLKQKLMKYLVLAGMPAPKGKVKTMKEIDQVAGGGTPPAELAKDQQILLDYLNRFAETGENEVFAHPFFGCMTKKQWGKLIYIHVDHHLKQFGH